MESHASIELLHSRVRLLTALCLLGSAVILARYWYVQILLGPKYAELATENSIEQVRLKAPRGSILDNSGIVLADNRPSYALWMRRYLKQPERHRILTRVAELYDRNVTAFISAFETRKRHEIVDNHILLVEDLTPRELASYEAHKYDLPNTRVTCETRRSYPYGRLAAHVLGNVGEINQELGWEKYLGVNVVQGDYIGKRGIEKSQDLALIGHDGYEFIEVDVHGRRIRRVEEMPSLAARPGSNVHLTIDTRLQRIVEETFQAPKGAIVALDPDTFEVRAMHSFPYFDPNDFAGRMNSGKWRELVENPYNPLFNRAIQSVYPPGSIYKIVTVLGGLVSGKVTERTTCYCPGRFWFGGRGYSCWKKEGHGTLATKDAIKHSCNVFFYQHGSNMGVDAIASVAEKLGFGQPTGVEIGPESAGTNPSNKWKRWKLHEQWWPGETLSVAIGQGYVQVTPMQIVKMLGVVANKGKVYQPTLIHAWESADGEFDVNDPEERMLGSVDMEESYWDLVRDGMIAVVEQGTARKAAVKGLKIWGKTGTAQAVNASSLPEKGEIPEHMRDHNWFASVCEAGNQRLCMIVFIENGGKPGGQWRLEYTAEIYRRYFADYIAANTVAEAKAPTNKPSAKQPTASASQPGVANPPSSPALASAPVAQPAPQPVAVSTAQE